LGQLLKHDLEIVVTDEGKQIDRRDEHDANADSSTIESREPASNATCTSFVHRRKQSSRMISIDAGMQIDPPPNGSPYDRQEIDARRIEARKARPSR
jgi:hypothetical protein